MGLITTNLPGLAVGPGGTVHNLEPLFLNHRRGVKEDIVRALNDIESEVMGATSAMLTPHAELMAQVAKSNDTLAGVFNKIESNLATTHTDLTKATDTIIQLWSRVEADITRARTDIESKLITSASRLLTANSESMALVAASNVALVDILDTVGNDLTTTRADLAASIDTITRMCAKIDKLEAQIINLSNRSILTKFWQDLKSLFKRRK